MLAWLDASCAPRFEGDLLVTNASVFTWTRSVNRGDAKGDLGSRGGKTAEQAIDSMVSKMRKVKPGMTYSLSICGGRNIGSSGEGNR